MEYNFSQNIDRIESSSLKWSARQALCGNPDAIPMWVADMDFAVPPEVTRAIVERARHPVYGYTLQSDNYSEATVSWMRRTNGWEVDKDWICFAPGVVPALSISVLALTSPGDRIMIQTPVYYPFYRSIQANGRTLVENPLRKVAGRYTMDLADLEEKLKQGVRMLILSSPHNPVGRVWSRDELADLGMLCKKYDTLILSDEIHSDLIMPGYIHTCIAAIDPSFSEITITCTAPSKTFNLAGLATANVIIPDSRLRKAYKEQSGALGFGLPPVFGAVALEAAYASGGNWLKQMILAVDSNDKTLDDFLSRYPSLFSRSRLEGTFLAWIDCSGLCARRGFDDTALAGFFTHQAGVWLDPGIKFGTRGSGYMRMNLACPETTLHEALSRIRVALDVPANSQ